MRGSVKTISPAMAGSDRSYQAARNRVSVNLTAMMRASVRCLMLFLILASVPLPILAPEVLLKPAPVVLVVSLISGVPLGCVRGVAAFRAIFMDALWAWAAATATPQRPTTAVTGGEIATMVSMSTAMLALPMPITAAPTPTATGDTHALCLHDERLMRPTSLHPGSAAPG